MEMGAEEAGLEKENTAFSWWSSDHFKAATDCMGESRWPITGHEKMIAVLALFGDGLPPLTFHALQNISSASCIST